MAVTATIFGLLTEFSFTHVAHICRDTDHGLRLKQALPILSRQTYLSPFLG